MPNLQVTAGITCTLAQCHEVFRVEFREREQMERLYMVRLKLALDFAAARLA